MAKKIEEVIEATPSEYFAKVKSSLSVMDKIRLRQYLATIEKLKNKAETVGQKMLARRLEFKERAVKCEIILNEKGYNKYIHSEDILNYMDNVRGRNVKLCDYKDYLREIPDEAVKIIEESKDYFDDFVILFTDYSTDTDILENVNKQREIDKDPILLGIFYNEAFNEAVDRFYFLYDWVDEYCDLTLDKMIEEYKEISEEELVKYNNIDLKELQNEIKQSKTEHQ